MSHAADANVEDLLRGLAPQVLGVLVRRTGDFAAAEDATQEALVAAASHWPRDGVPGNPRAWLVQTATRRLIDEARSASARRRREGAVVARDVVDADVPGRDDTLTLLFMCCHPSLTPGSAIPLTLRAVGGLTTAEIAHAFLVPEATMAQRISRAKQRVKAGGARFTMPTPEELPSRLRSVLHVLYLMFTEGSTSSVGASLQRVELSDEAIRLTDARRAARTGPSGELVPLDEQDRSLWDHAAIHEGVALAVSAMSHGAIGEYQLQAAIAALHDEAPSVAETDWPQIAALYTLLERMSHNPMVTLNRAIAVAMCEGPAAGLRMLDALDEPLGDHYRLDAVRGHLHEIAGDVDTALAHYDRAARRTTSIPEQRYLTTKAARLRAAWS